MNPVTLFANFNNLEGWYRQGMTTKVKGTDRNPGEHDGIAKLELHFYVTSSSEGFKQKK